METLEMLSKVYDGSTIVRSKVFEWHRCFKEGRRSVLSDEVKEHRRMSYGRLRKMASSCASKSYTNVGRSVSSPKETT
ncbi:hypothetical protein TNCV_3638321 [Trichonephila clavipes]|nr:hypothetical protein TNCV_3638321 [Trichonephila clavipes]